MNFKKPKKWASVFLVAITLAGIGSTMNLQNVNAADSASVGTTNKTASGKTVGLYSHRDIAWGDTFAYSIKATYPDNEGKYDNKDAGLKDTLEDGMTFKSVKAFDESGKDVTSSLFNMTSTTTSFNLTAKDPATLMGETITYEVFANYPAKAQKSMMDHLDKDGNILTPNTAIQFYAGKEKKTNTPTVTPPMINAGTSKKASTDEEDWKDTLKLTKLDQNYYYQGSIQVPTSKNYKKLSIRENFDTYQSDAKDNYKFFDEDGKDVTDKGTITTVKGTENDHTEYLVWTANDPSDFYGQKLSFRLKADMAKITAAQKNDSYDTKDNRVEVHNTFTLLLDDVPTSTSNITTVTPPEVDQKATKYIEGEAA